MNYHVIPSDELDIHEESNKCPCQPKIANWIPFSAGYEPAVYVHQLYEDTKQ